MANTNGIKYILGRKHMFDSNAKTERLCVCVCVCVCVYILGTLENIMINKTDMPLDVL